MEDMGGVLAETPEVEVQESQPESQPSQEQTQESPESGPKSAREYSQWLKGGMDATHPDAQKFARIAKDNYARMFALSQIEPKGIDGIREKYALLDSITHGDLKGVEAVQQLQNTIQEVSNLDERVVSGDFGVWEEFGPEMQAGILKMVPNFLDMQRQQDPEGYAKSILPHFVEELRSSDLLRNHNAMVDVLKEQPPSWLPPDRVDAWQADKMRRLIGFVDENAKWFNAQQKRAEEYGNIKSPVNGQQNGRQLQTQPQNEAQQLQNERQQLHYERNITPKTNQYAENKFKELLRPYNSRLKLSEATQSGLASDFVKAVTAKANANPVFKSQMARFYNSKNPDPAQVLNLFKIEFDKHAQSALKGLIDSRYGSFLNGNGKQQSPQPKATVPVNKGPVQPKEYVVTSKPKTEDILMDKDYLTLYPQGKYKMKDGRIAVYRK